MKNQQCGGQVGISLKIQKQHLHFLTISSIDNTQCLLDVSFVWTCQYMVRSIKIVWIMFGFPVAEGKLRKPVVTEGRFGFLCIDEGLVKKRMILLLDFLVFLFFFVFSLTLCMSHRSSIGSYRKVAETPFWYNICNSQQL